MKLEVNKVVKNKYSHFYISTINNQYWKKPNFPFLFIACYPIIDPFILPTCMYCILPLFSSPITTPTLLKRFPTRKGKNFTYTYTIMMRLWVTYFFPDTYLHKYAKSLLFNHFLANSFPSIVIGIHNMPLPLTCIHHQKL